MQAPTSQRRSAVITSTASCNSEKRWLACTRHPSLPTLSVCRMLVGLTWLQGAVILTRSVCDNNFCLRGRVLFMNLLTLSHHVGRFGLWKSTWWLLLLMLFVVWWHLYAPWSHLGIGQRGISRLQHSLSLICPNL